jgi:hypothetical protein
MLHFKGDAVELGSRQRYRAFAIDGTERDKGSLTLFEGFDYAVKAGYVCHTGSFAIGLLQRV